MDINTQNIIARLKEAVEASGLTYAQLSEITNIPRSTLQRWISGQIKRIPIDDIQLIAVACGVSAEWIMGWADDAHDPIATASSETEQLAELLKQLPDDLVRQVLDYTRWLISQHKT